MGRTLLVDDDPGTLRMYKRVLEHNNIEVVTAADGATALALIRAERPFDVIVSDIEMPGLTGLELLHAVRERDLDVPVILMTAGSALKAATDALAFGASLFLLKPVTPVELATAVQRALGSRH